MQRIGEGLAGWLDKRKKVVYGQGDGCSSDVSNRGGYRLKDEVKADGWMG